MIMDFGLLKKIAEGPISLMRGANLNEIEGLGAPTLENMSIWLWGKLAPELPQLVRIEIARPKDGDGCVYEGPEGFQRPSRKLAAPEPRKPKL
jgi:6-pyruvoyltetrahydropterin/6-carboxytetrahydropterin synthase